MSACDGRTDPESDHDPRHSRRRFTHEVSLEREEEARAVCDASERPKVSPVGRGNGTVETSRAVYGPSCEVEGREKHQQWS